MHDVEPQTHEIVVYRNRKRLILGVIILALLCLFIVGMDVFVIWAFWNHYEINTGAYADALVSSIATLFIGWSLFILLYNLRERGPAITINSQGFSFYFPLRFTLMPQFKQNFIPWEEIEWIASVRIGMYTWIALRLKDPAHYWSLYGNGPFRTWRRDLLTGAHINLAQHGFSLTARQILQQVQENYSSELLKYEVKLGIKQL